MDKKIKKKVKRYMKSRLVILNVIVYILIVGIFFFENAHKKELDIVNKNEVNDLEVDNENEYFFVKENEDENEHQQHLDIIINYLVKFIDNCNTKLLDCDKEIQRVYIKSGFEEKGIQMALYFL